jgi:hypothetical protein
LGVRSSNDPAAAAQLRRAQEDYGWFMNQPEHLDRYKGLVVVLYNRVVVGCGPTLQEAFADAEQRAQAQQQPLPPRHQLLSFSVPERPWIEEWMLPPRARGTNGQAPEKASG